MAADLGGRPGSSAGGEAGEVSRPNSRPKTRPNLGSLLFGTRGGDAVQASAWHLHEAKTQLSKLVDRAVKGETFVIAKAGKPLVKVVALKAEPQRLGFLAGEIAVPDDFNRMGEAEITALFGSGA